jgi:hypothetical protein
MVVCVVLVSLKERRWCFKRPSPSFFFFFGGRGVVGARSFFGGAVGGRRVTRKVGVDRQTNRQTDKQTNRHTVFGVRALPSRDKLKTLRCVEICVR